MANYISRDLLASDDGELDLSSGDLSVAGTRQSHRQLLINALNTTRGGYRFDPNFGWGVERYIGKPVSPLTFEVMSQDLNIMFRDVDDIAREDIFFTITPIDVYTNTIAIIARHTGVFIEPDGEQLNTALILGWKYSFETGKIEAES